MGINPRTGAVEIQNLETLEGASGQQKRGFIWRLGPCHTAAGLQSDFVWTKVVLVFFRRVS